MTEAIRLIGSKCIVNRTVRSIMSLSRETMAISIILLMLIIVVLFEHISTFHFPNGFVYRGKIFKSEDYPYVMFLKFWNSPKYYNGCTGTLVKKMFVLTAAHCCYERTESDVQVYQGSPLVSNPDIHKVVKIFKHKDYDPVKNKLGVRGDLCVLQLEKPFKNIKKFMKIGGSPNDFKNGKRLNCKMFGFGGTGDNRTKGHSGYMMTNDVVYGEKACELHQSEEIHASWTQYLCLVPNGYSTTCQGDSGGPMICNGVQYGVCSFGYPFSGNPGGCGVPDQQEIYAFIYVYKEWLFSIIGSNKDKKNKKKRSSGNFLKPHCTLHIVLLILLNNILSTFI